MQLKPFRIALVALAFAGNLAHAQFFSDGEARKSAAEAHTRITAMNQAQRQIEERLAAIEAQLRSGGLVDLANQLESTRAEMAKLRGQIEVLTYELGEAQKRQRDLYVDLDSRMRRVESAQAAAAQAAQPAQGAMQPPPSGVDPNAAGTLAPATPGIDASATPTTPSGTSGGDRTPDLREQRAYDAALDLFKRGDYSGAINAFGTFVRTYPRTALASSAQYWIGNAHFARRDFRAAITAQRTLIANYPDSAKVPDALLNIASAQGELGDTAGARRTLEDLVAKHPQSEAAGKAKQRLAGR